MSVASIGGYAFAGCESLASVDIPSSVTSIGGYAFRGCTSLASVDILSSVTSIGDGAFCNLADGSVIRVPNAKAASLAEASCDAEKTRVVIDLSKASVKVAGSFSYTGKELKPAPTVQLDGKTLKKGTDYTVGYKNNVKAGTATVTVKGKGSYAGTASATFKIAKASIAGAKVVASKASYTYTGKVQKPTVKTVGGKALKSGTDYTLKYSNSSSKAAGSYTVWVVGKGNYAGTSAKATYKIAKAANTLTAKAKAASVAYSKTAARSIAASKWCTLSKAQGKVTYKKSKVPAGITVASNGKITVKKGLKKGAYTIKVQVTAAGNANYKSATKTVSVKITVK